jgi:non-specific serine/threonine protein kinase
VRTENQLAAALGEEEFQAAYAEGFSMGAEPAAHFARRDTAPPEPSGSTTRQPSSTLSKREREVASLIAQGLSNREVADNLVISQRTAEGHVARIMDKLGVHSPAGIATWVASGPQ